MFEHINNTCMRTPTFTQTHTNWLWVRRECPISKWSNTQAEVEALWLTYDPNAAVILIIHSLPSTDSKSGDTWANWNDDMSGHRKQRKKLKNVSCISSYWHWITEYMKYLWFHEWLKKITIVDNNNSSAVHPVNSFELLLTFSYLDDLDDITLTFGKRSVIAR